jgi:excisionase family DNA binding protein
MKTFSTIRIRFNTNQAAEYLGRTLGAIRNMVLRRQIPFRKVGGRLIFFKDEIDRWEDGCPGITAENLLAANEHH